MKRAVTACALAACVVAMLAASACTPAAARLEGNWTVKLTATKSVNSTVMVGHAYPKQWGLTPQCASGPCATNLERPGFDGMVVDYTLESSSASQYRGTVTYLSRCVDDNGHVLAPKGYTSTETVTLDITKSADSTATAFTGKLVETFKPTAAGQAKGCKAGEIDADIKSVKRVETQPTVRLTGDWQVRGTVTRSINSVNPVGAVYVRPWKFTPQCTTGGCSTKLSRQRNSDTKFVDYTLTPKSATQYSGSRNYLSDCFDDNGNVKVVDGYTNSEVVTINITKNTNGTATAFGGTLIVRTTATSAGSAQGCETGEADLKLESVNRTS